MPEYKVLEIALGKKSERRLFGIPGLFVTPTPPEEIENLLNQHAEQGWKVVSCVPVNSTFLGIDGGERLTVVLERESRPCSADLC